MITRHLVTIGSLILQLTSLPIGGELAAAPAETRTLPDFQGEERTQVYVYRNSGPVNRWEDYQRIIRTTVDSLTNDLVTELSKAEGYKRPTFYSALQVISLDENGGTLDLEQARNVWEEVNPLQLLWVEIFETFNAVDTFVYLGNLKGKFQYHGIPLTFPISAESVRDIRNAHRFLLLYVLAMEAQKWGDNSIAQQLLRTARLVAADLNPKNDKDGKLGALVLIVDESLRLSSDVE